MSFSASRKFVRRLADAGQLPTIELLIANLEDAAIEYGQMEALGPCVTTEDFEKAQATLEKARNALRRHLKLPD